MCAKDMLLSIAALRYGIFSASMRLGKQSWPYNSIVAFVILFFSFRNDARDLDAERIQESR